MIDGVEELVSLPVVFVVAVLAAAGGLAMAENIDPANDGSKYAWAENLVWVNARWQRRDTQRPGVVSFLKKY